MARSWQPSCEDEEDEEDLMPIFSMSKSSMDVFMAAGPLHARDPAWPRLRLPRSCSTNTYVEKNAPTLQQLHARHGNARSPLQPLGSTHLLCPRRFQPLSGRWLANAELWSAYSGSAQSVDSTPETVVYRGGTTRPWSLAQEALHGSSPDCLVSKPAYPPAIPSPDISPVQTPLLSLADASTTPSSAFPLYTQQHEDTGLPIPSVHTSPLPSLSSSAPEIQPVFSKLSLENDSFPQKHDLSHSSSQWSSISSRSSSLEQRGSIERGSSEPGCVIVGSVERVPGVPFNPGSVHSLVRSPTHVQMSTLSSSDPSVKVREPRGCNSLCNLELPGQNVPSDSSICLGWRLPLMCSLSDSHLGDYNSRRHYDPPALEMVTLMASPHTRVKVTQGEGTITSKARMVDAAVQTISPPGSWWSIKTHMSLMSPSVGSHSFLGSPPVSKLCLRSSLGSHSNLVSPLSSMFQVESVGVDGSREDRNLEWNRTLIHRERRRSCLKAGREERPQSVEGEEMGRRGSLKQVQWDEDSSPCGNHRGVLDPAELSTAIQKHMELQGRESPQLSRRRTEEKSTTAAPAATTLPVTVGTATTVVKNHRARMDTDGKKEGGCMGRNARRNRPMKQTEVVEGREEEDNEVYGERGVVRRRSTRRSEQRLKKGVMRSLKPGWCGSSSQVMN